VVSIRSAANVAAVWRCARCVAFPDLRPNRSGECAAGLSDGHHQIVPRGEELLAESWCATGFNMLLGGPPSPKH